MYDIDRIHLVYTSGCRGALSNICHGNGYNKFATVLDLKDAVEDSKDAKALLRNLSKLNLIGMNNMLIDRDVMTYTRIKGYDGMGNIHFLVCHKI